MKFAATLSAAILLLTCSTASAERMQEYSAPDYGFSFQAPTRLQVTKSGTADHGWGVFLDYRTRHLQFPSDRRRYVSVFAPASGLRHDLDSLVDDYCNRGGSKVPPPDDLSFRNAHSVSCREDKDGRIDVWVVSVDGTGSFALNHVARLHTNASHFEADLKIFRGVVRSVRIFPPP
jgi:hypothetical protein